MIQSFRDQMTVDDGFAYFDHAGVAPISAPAREAIVQWADDLSTYGVTHWQRWRTEIEKTRRLCAQLINARREEIALVHSTTEGINLVAEGYPWQKGDNVVLPKGEFPSNLYPWLLLERRGVEVRQVEMPDNVLDIDRLRNACDENTRIVSCSWVGFGHGYRVDLNELADAVHEKGALLFVDAIQGLGVFPLDVTQTPIDFLAADGHKWVLGPEGAGLFFTRQEHLETLQPMGIGWNSVTTSGDFQNECLNLRPTAARYEGGTFNVVGNTGFRASLELLVNHGIDNVSNAIHETTNNVIERLKQVGCTIQSVRDDKHWSGIVSFDVPGKDPFAVKEFATSRDVVVNARNGHVRVSPHAYTNETDIERLMEIVNNC
ncbi:aminotransferase class V-fold PLP-dependent enzyme [Rubinisphaera sp. JC750]|uniref:aminotransferase class V-fold PLP-dependent enzyme n=1 Tax=Rubinisphaera sp. JC750 TaxID=2898658 RepID=UPI001F300451|nr:aminotransferase class V-fold PLP-dependent enzyme [Rubinisphaera sp. JC750]